MASLPESSVDSIVTDPPYELGFMGKKWDSSGVAYSVDVWGEALRVLKPGGHLLAFGGSRTYHRMACAIEDAGFEIRDQIMWIYGSGFPKSLDVSKAIDKAAGIWRGRAGAVASGNAAMSGGNYERTAKGSGETAAAAAWDGWGTALKPAHEPIVVARKPLIGTVAENVLAHGTGAINVDGCRIGTDGGCKGAGAGAGAGARVFTDALNGTFAPPVPGLGRWPANVIHDGSEEVVDEFDLQGKRIGIHPAGSAQGPQEKWANPSGDYLFNGIGKGPCGARIGDSGSAARFFYCAKATASDREWALRDGGIGALRDGGIGALRDGGRGTLGKKQQDPGRKEGNPGGDNPRNRGLAKRHNHHPTVKPLDLMRYLCRLVTPPGGTVLDPFAGSGSTLRGAFLEGFKPIGIELDAEYCQIADARMNLLTAPLPFWLAT